MVQAVQNQPNPFNANVPPLAASRTTPLAGGEARAFIPDASAVVSLGAERSDGLVYNPDGTLDVSAARFAPELLLLQATRSSATLESATTGVPLVPGPTPATLALALDDGFDPENFDPVATLLGTAVDNGIFVPGRPAEPPAGTPGLPPASPDTATRPEAAGPLFAQPEPAAPAPREPTAPTAPTPPEVSAPEPQAVAPAPTAAPGATPQPDLQRAEAREAELQLAQARAASATAVRPEAEALLDTLATTDAREAATESARTAPNTPPVTTPRTEADALLAADLQAFTQAETASGPTTTSEQVTPAPSSAAAPAGPMNTTAVTPQQAANNPFAPAMAASLYLSAMSFRTQQSSSAGLDNPAEAVQPVGGVRAVSPTFFNREGPADDSRRPGV